MRNGTSPLPPLRAGARGCWLGIRWLLDVSYDYHVFQFDGQQNKRQRKANSPSPPRRAGFSAFTDLYLAVYPTIVLFKLQINNKKKIALCFALGIGSVSAIVSVYKSTRLPSLARPDFSWDTTDLVIWSL